MQTPSLTLEEVLPSLGTKDGEAQPQSRVEILIDPSNGSQTGLLVESAFERVVVTKLDHPEVSLEDVSRMRHLLLHTRARRGLLCVPFDAVVPNPVMLLATLSRIEIVRL
jgi:hypothetical protein